MAYDIQLAEKIRDYLKQIPGLRVEEKKMFRGLTFMVNGKMCVSVSGENLMCRFDPQLQEEISRKNGFKTMVMRGKEYNGYCYVQPQGFNSKKDFEQWINLCLDFNKEAKSSKKKS
ncbi:MAG: TfoX/Sxy family protein [Flavisolibacter sp.]